MLAFTAILTCANLLAIHLELLAVLAYYVEPADYVVDQEIWFPMLLAVWSQTVVNGAILFAWKRTRTVGAGILLGALCVALAFGVYMVFVIAVVLHVGS
jgi:hypothetical protein